MSSAYTLKSLKTELRKYGGKLSGNKSELTSRLDRLVSCTATYKDFPYGEVSEIYIKNLKKNKNKKIEKKNKKVCHVDCCICMESIVVDECKKTECNHMFHEGCINRWLENASSCPLCRAQIGNKVVIQSVPSYYLERDDESDDDEWSSEEARYEEEIAWDDLTSIRNMLIRYRRRLDMMDTSNFDNMDRIQYQLYIIENDRYTLMANQFENSLNLLLNNIRDFDIQTEQYRMDMSRWMHRF